VAQSRAAFIANPYRDGTHTPPLFMLAVFHSQQEVNAVLNIRLHILCPQMDTTNRYPTPQLVSPTADQARKSFDANRSDYAYNRVKGLLSSSTMYG